jgi:hypothetical protein
MPKSREDDGRELFADAEGLLAHRLSHSRDDSPAAVAVGRERRHRDQIRRGHHPDEIHFAKGLHGLLGDMPQHRLSEILAEELDDLSEIADADQNQGQGRSTLLHFKARA